MYCYCQFHVLTRTPDIFFFKPYRYSLLFQQPYRLQHVHCISGKSADGLGNDTVNFTIHCFLYHFLKHRSLINPDPASIIYINTRKQPVGLFFNITLIIARDFSLEPIIYDIWWRFSPPNSESGGTFCPHSGNVAKILFRFIIHTKWKLSISPLR